MVLRDIAVAQAPKATTDWGCGRLMLACRILREGYFEEGLDLSDFTKIG